MEILAIEPLNIDWALFSSVYDSVYANCNYKPLSEDIDYEHLTMVFIALLDGKVVGRVSVYINHDLSYKTYTAGLLGNFECINNKELCMKLFMEAIFFLKEQKIQYVIGPMNGSTWYNYRFSLHNNFTNFFLEPHHPLYYNNLWSENGFEPIANYISCIDRHLAYNNKFVSVREKQLTDQGVIFRNLNINVFDEEIRKIYEFSLEAFKNNFLYTPISWNIFIEKYRKIQFFLKQEHIIIAEDKGHVAGFIFCIDNITEKLEKSLILKTIAVKNLPKYTGMGQILTTKIVQYAQIEGYTNIIHAFMKDDNVSAVMSKKHASESYKSYVLYGQKL